VTEEVQPDPDISMAEAFENVVVTREQAAQILNRLAEMFTDSGPEIREAFLTGANAVLAGA
jgi:hypothetical protein